jgi:hypothetical protein
VAERVLPQDDWAFFRRWAWNDARPGVDHWVPVHAPERLSELLVDFLG